MLIQAINCIVTSPGVWNFKIRETSINLPVVIYHKMKVNSKIKEDNNDELKLDVKDNNIGNDIKRILDAFPEGKVLKN